MQASLTRLKLWYFNDICSLILITTTLGDAFYNKKGSSYIFDSINLWQFLHYYAEIRLGCRECRKQVEIMTGFECTFCIERRRIK